MNKFPATLLLATCLSAFAGLCRSADTPAVAASLSADKPSVFQWEPFTVTLTMRNTGVRLDSSLSLSALAPEDELELVENFSELQMQQTVVNRETHTIRRFRCRARALKPGKLKLAPVIHAQQVTRVRSFFGWDYRRTPYPVQVAPIEITVQPIPESGRPASFSGAIGKLAFEVDITPTELAVGDLVTATLRVSGDGYLENMTPPAISPGRHFKAYDLKARETTPNLRVFGQTIVPQNSNAVRIAAVSFCYFDTDAREYRTVTKGPFPLKFRAAKEVVDDPYVSTAPDPAASARRADAQSSTDLSALATAPRSRGVFIGLVAALACAALVGLWLIVRLRHRAVVVLLYLVVGIQLLALYHTVRHGLLAPPIRITVRAATARLAPADTALATFDAPAGSTVRLIESYNNWRKIELKDKRGWISSAALTEPRSDSNAR